MRVKRFHVRKLSGEDFVYMEVKVANPEDPKSARRVDFLVDTGAAGCAIPKRLADELGLREKGSVDVGLADGRSVKASASYILLEVDRRKVYTWAIIGEGFEPILGMDVMKILKVHVNARENQSLIPLKRFNINAITINCNFRSPPGGWDGA